MSGNPKGRPVGARQRLSESVLDALARDFKEHGVEAIVRLRESDPGAYLRTICSLIPRELSIDADRRPPLVVLDFAGTPSELLPAERAAVGRNREVTGARAQGVAE